MTPEILNRVKEIVEPSLKSAVDSLSPEIALPVSYHFGWVDEKGKPASGGGKGIRPALAVLSAEYVGEKADKAIPGAVAVELVHNFSLLHDDVIDKDLERRHRPTIWNLFGIEDAIIAGDALLALAFQVLLKVDSTHSQSASAELASATSKMIAGQRADMVVEDRRSLQDCEAMEAQKTGALLACSSSIGAILAGGNAAQIAALRIYGMELGLAFQAIDDLLGIWGDPKVTGKPVGNDIREKKKSLPIVLALEASEHMFGYSDKLISALGQDEMSEADISSIIQTLEELGVREQTQKLANQHLEAALLEIKKNSAEPSVVAELVELAEFVISRDF